MVEGGIVLISISSCASSYAGLDQSGVSLELLFWVF